MPVRHQIPRRGRRPRQGARGRLQVEQLETRSLPAAFTLPGVAAPLVDAEPNDTLDLAQDLAQGLGSLNDAGSLGAVGTVGNGASAVADVDWYTFTLARPAAVTLTTVNRPNGSTLASVLSLYNNATDVFDLYAPLGYRLLAQDDGAARGGDARLDRLLAPGTYCVAVSGSGNRFFHPFLADSGSEGETGDYGLLVTATDLVFDPDAGPAVLAAEPAAGAAWDRSPFVIRLALSSALDPNTVVPGVNVLLTFNPAGTFGDGNDQDVPLTANFSASANELQMSPAAPLAPGHYQLFLGGDGGSGLAVLTDPLGVPLGKNDANPAGSDFVLTFEVNGVEGNTSAVADDTAAGAHDLGDVTGAGLVQVAGAVGDDPAYDPANADPLLANPAADVDLYRFHVGGPGRYVLIVEAAAGRVGSLLDTGVALFDSQMRLLDANDNTLNPSQAADGSTPLGSDAVVYAGLTEGDYYLAVSSGGNVPDPLLGQSPGTGGVFDPTVSHSGQNGFTTGDYVLSLLVHPDDEAPRVESVTPAEGDTLAAAPARLTVQFNEPVNLQQLAYRQYQLTSQGDLRAVYVVGADGTTYYPRLLSYDGVTNRADFLLLDRLPNGVNELHLAGTLSSGDAGLTDLAGNRLAGSDANDPAADYVVRFTVNGPAAGTGGNPLLWSDQEPNDALAQAQVLGVLFPRELQAGVRVARDFTRNPAAAPADTADFYQFEVLQSRTYFFTLTNTAGLPAGTRPQLFTAAGNPIPTVGGAVRSATLDPGTYVVRVGGWTPAQAASAKYQLRLSLGGSLENPPPLTVGPAPAYRIRLASPTPPPPPPVDPPVPPPPPPVDPVVPPQPAPTTPPVDPLPPTIPPVDPPVIPPPPPPVDPPPATPPTSPPPAPPSSGTPPPTVPPTNTTPPPSSPDVQAPPTHLVLPPSTGTSIAASGTSEAPANTRGLPPDALIALSVPPVGGVRGTNQAEGPAAPDRLVLTGTERPAADGQIRLTSTNQTWLSGGEDADPSLNSTEVAHAAPLPAETSHRPWSSGDAKPAWTGAGFDAIFRQPFRLWQQLRQRAVEGLCGTDAPPSWLGPGLQQLWGPLTVPASPPQQRADEEPDAEVSGGADEASRGLSAPDWMWASGLLAATGAGAVAARKRHTTRAVAPRLGRKKGTGTEELPEDRPGA